MHPVSPTISRDSREITRLRPYIAFSAYIRISTPLSFLVRISRASVPTASAGKTDEKPLDDRAQARHS